ncbi:MAG: hypothetical protein ACK500_12810 [Flavobacteriales bacterium]
MNRYIFFTLAVIVSQSSAAAQTTLTDSLIHQDLQRQYMLRLPPGYSEEFAPYPLVMVLHGGSGTMANIQGFSQMNAVADEMDFIAVYPQGMGTAAS